MNFIDEEKKYNFYITQFQRYTQGVFVNICIVSFIVLYEFLRFFVV